jgi:hypothetical protein
VNRQLAGDKRRWERRLVDVPIRVVANDLRGAGIIAGRGTKMSEGGICLFALANLAIGAQIDVELVDSHCVTPVRISGIVRNRVVYLYGVEFVIDRPGDRQQIARLSHSLGGTTRPPLVLVPITVPFASSAFGTPVTTTDEPLHKPQEQRKLTLDDAEVMVAAGRPGHSRVRGDDGSHTRARSRHCATHRIECDQHIRHCWKFNHAITANVRGLLEHLGHASQ